MCSAVNSVALFLLLAGCADDELIVSLGDNKFYVREKSSFELKRKMNAGLYMRIKSFKKQTDDLEIIWRIELIMDYYEKSIHLLYKMDLGDYYPYWPFIDSMPFVEVRRWGIPTFERQNIINSYRFYAQIGGVPSDGAPNWSQYRKATELWMQDRISESFRQAVAESKDEKELHVKMEEKMKKHQELLEIMKKGDDTYWKNVNQNNPARKQKN